MLWFDWILLSLLVGLPLVLYSQKGSLKCFIGLAAMFSPMLLYPALCIYNGEPEQAIRLLAIVVPAWLMIGS